MWSVFVEQIDQSNPNLDLLQCDMHLLDDEFVNLLNTCMGDMVDGKWQKGLYREVPGVLSDVKL